MHVDPCDDVNVAELSPQYRHIIDKVRKIVKLFRKSPVKNDSILQKYVKEAHQGKELSLLLDCPTRWNSLVTMLSRFSLLRTSIQKAMIDLKAPEQPTDPDFAVVDEIIAALEPVALAVQVLSRKDVNLLSAEAAIQFCVAQLREQQSQLGKTMAAALLSRVRERYAIHSTVLRYLHFGDESSEFSEREVSGMTIRKFIHQLLLRLDQGPSCDRAAVVTAAISPSSQESELAQSSFSGDAAANSRKSSLLIFDNCRQRPACLDMSSAINSLFSVKSIVSTG